MKKQWLKKWSFPGKEISLKEASSFSGGCANWQSSSCSTNHGKLWSYRCTTCQTGHRSESREAEIELTYNEYKDKKGDLLTELFPRWNMVI
ncbi:MAG: hypothetical protein CM1200mP16_11470 [Nitrospina sp.]|nr:MAG: hypothetical protein CM1200mP16_11470 [Nitrospina sp.]